MEGVRVPRSAPVLAAAAGVCVTAAVAVVPSLRFAYRNPELHLALVTSEAVIAMLAALLAAARFRRSRQLDALLLATGLGVFGLAGLLFSAVPAIFADDTSDFASWSSLLGRLVGVGLLGAAALWPTRTIRGGSPLVPATAGGALAALAVIAVTVGLIGADLPSAVDPDATPENSGGLHPESHVLVLLSHGVALIVYAAASVGFSRRAWPGGDPLFAALAVGCALAAVGRLNYMLFASASTPYVYLGDAFRLLFYLVILAGTIAEIGTYWRSVAQAAALEERRAIARDLHDGIAQELAGVQRNLHYLDPDDRFVARAREAADRGAAVARQALFALSDRPDEGLASALTAAARTAAEREGTELSLSLSAGAQAARPEQEALAGIVSEAITNAARHGRAQRVTVELAAGRELVLRITDDGSGFDADATSVPRADHHGFGLPGMRARAESIGARLALRSSPGGGTTVEVRL